MLGILLRHDGRYVHFGCQVALKEKEKEERDLMKRLHSICVRCENIKSGIVGRHNKRSGRRRGIDGVAQTEMEDDDELAERLRAQRTAIGGVPGSLEVWLLLRSLRTLPLRLERHNTSAILIAAWLQQSIKEVDKSQRRKL